MLHAPLNCITCLSVLHNMFIVVASCRHLICSNFQSPPAAMAAFAQLRGRVGASRLSLGASVLGSPLHTCQSKLQANAVIAELSKDIARVLTPDERSKLSDMVLAANFTPADAVSIMEAMTPPDGKKQRAASQDHVAFLGYVSEDEWSAAVTGVEAATQVFLNVIVHRLGCTHACEFTLKRVAAAALACATLHSGGSVGEILQDVKAAQLLTAKKQYHKLVRKVKKTPPVPPLPYIITLPARPEDLVTQHPTLLDHYKIEGCWTPPRVSISQIQIVDMSMNCRGGPSVNGPIAMPLQGHQMMQTMMQMQQAFMMQVMRQNGSGSPDDELDVRFCSGDGPRKRSLRAMMPGPGSVPALPASWKRYKPDDYALDDAPARVDAPSRVDAPARVDAANVVGTVPAAPIDAPAPVDAPTDAAPAPADGAQSMQVIPAGAAALVHEPPSSTRGATLLDALLERDRERAEVKKQEKVAEKERVAAEKAAEKDAEARKCIGKNGIDKIPIAKKVQEPTKKVQEPKVVDPPKKEKTICVNHEASRTQYLARSAGPSKGFPYGAGKEYKTADKALTAAKAWLQRQPKA